jgi:hypothetical protein
MQPPADRPLFLTDAQLSDIARATRIGLGATSREAHAMLAEIRAARAAHSPTAQAAERGVVSLEIGGHPLQLSPQDARALAWQIWAAAAED